MNLPFDNKKFLLLFVRFGKVKSRLLYFIFLLICGAILSITYDLFNSIISHVALAKEIKGNYHFLLCYLLYSIFISWNFYDLALKKLQENQSLKAKGLSHEDIQRIAFIKDWEIKRRPGVIKFCWYDGGLIAGMIIFIPVSLIFYYIYATWIFSEFINMIYIIIICIIMGYILGVVIFRIRWAINERKFIRLTDPLLLK